MKVVIAHNRYRISGGEDAMVEREMELLRATGHEVIPYFRSSKEELGGAAALRKLKVASELSFSKESFLHFKNFLRETNPDLVHAHNIFPLLTPSIFRAASDLSIPSVLTLHNFRFICANALFLRDGSPCEKCLDGSPLWGTWFGCYRGSSLATLPLTRMIQGYRKGAALAEEVGYFIALSEFSRSKFLAAGIPSDRLLIKPNFTEDPGAPPAWETRKNFALYVGRLSPEKGILTLITALRGLDIPVKVVGDGPNLNDLRAAELPFVEVLGAQSPEQVATLMRSARLLILPSICYENFPVVLVEAWSHGLPVLASRIGSIASLIHEDRDGLFFKAGDPTALARGLEKGFSSELTLKRISAGGRQRFLADFSPDANAAQLLAIYQLAMNAKRPKEIQHAKK